MVYGRWCVVSGVSDVRCLVCGMQSMVCDVWCVVWSVAYRCVVCGLWCEVKSV